MTLFKTNSSSEEREIIDSISSNGINRKKGEERLFNRYTYLIQEGIYKYSLSHEEAFDVYSDTIISAIDNIANNKFQEQSSLKTWVYGIYHHKYVDLVRKKTTNKSSVYRVSDIPDALLQVSDEAKTILQQLISKTDHEVLRQKLLQIGLACKELLLYWADGYPDKEITQFMNYKTADVVKTTRLRCLEKLKQLYQAR
ncbi:MAG: RNA polymerase sigma factor [Flavisolibacter sp.]